MFAIVLPLVNDVFYWPYGPPRQPSRGGGGSSRFFDLIRNPSERTHFYKTGQSASVAATDILPNRTIAPINGPAMKAAQPSPFARARRCAWNRPFFAAHAK